MKAVSFFFLSCFLSLTAVRAQQAPKPAGQAERPAYTLQQQFNSLKARSSSYTEANRTYKVMRVDQLDRLWKNVGDSLKGREAQIRKAGKATEQALVKARQDLKAQNEEIQGLKNDNQQKQKAIEQTSHDIASLSVFGLDMNKQVYVILSWIVILGLGILAGIFAFLYKKSKVVTDEKIHAYEDISQEYKEYKQNAREREIKIKRELQTETNKIEELNQQIIQLKKQVSL
ncbi:MAG: hypothetical protein ACO1O1_14635 [Adhaeribacter sp.]